MIYKAFSAFSNVLISKPETGMGYQVIDARKSGKFTSERFVVYNSELIVELDNRFETFKRQIISEGFSNILNKSDLLSLEIVNVLPKSQIKQIRFLAESKRNNMVRYSGGVGAIDAKKENADGKEVFVRLSAYADDKRIDFANKKLKPGSYTTTLIDYQTCKRLNDDPVDRYALPNDETIKWAFHIQPKTSDQLQRGIVQPAFGHDGGGIEAYFENGTSIETFLYKLPYL